MSFTVSSDSDWLSVSPDSGTSTGSSNPHQVSVNINGLSEGTYNGQLTIADPNASNSPQTVDVTLTLSTEPPPKFLVDKTSLEFDAVTTDPNPTSQSFTVTNSGEGTLNYTIIGDAAWFSVSPTNGTSTGNGNSHSVSIDKSSLGEGTYNGTITITDPDALNSPETVDVTLTLSTEPPPKILLDKTSLEFDALTTDPNPTSQSFTVTNSGEGTLNYTIIGDEAWFSVSPTDGTSTGNDNSHSVSIDKSSLGEGTYDGTITITDPDALNSPETVDVTLTLSTEPPPEIWVDTTSLEFDDFTTGPDPSSQSFSVKNTGEGTLNYTIIGDAAWFSVSPTDGTSTGNDNSHSVSIDKSSLGEGTYDGTITITDPDALNSPETVDVTLTLSTEPPPEIWVDTTSLEFDALISDPDPSSQSFTVMNSGASTLNYTIIGDAPWFSVSPTDGTSTGNGNSHSVSIDKSSLGEGTYNGTITIADPNALNSPQLISVTLIVYPPDTSNEISISCNPSFGATDKVVTVIISIKGNSLEIDSFGVKVNFNATMFDYLSSDREDLTSGWSVDGNETSSGVITVGGFAGGSSAIPTGSEGRIAVLEFKVTCSGCSDGATSQFCLDNLSLIDDISGMSINPACVTFTFDK